MAERRGGAMVFWWRMGDADGEARQKEEAEGDVWSGAFATGIPGVR